MKRLLMLVIISSIEIGSANAHPVTYKGGYSLTGEYTEERKEGELSYSFSEKDAFAFSLIELKTEYEGEKDSLVFLLPKYNTRLYRRNELDSQANVYLFLGLGAVNNDSETHLSSLFGAQADYETRRIYTLASLETIQSEGDLDYHKGRYRLGFSPYLTGYDSIHTWLIGQVEYSTSTKDPWTFTPLVRFFYKTYLLEVGSSTRGDIFVTGMIHF